MPIATSFHEIKPFVRALSAVGGVLPPRLQGLLTAYELMSSPAGVQHRDDPIVDLALAGELTAEKLQELLPAAALANLTNTYRSDLARVHEHTLVGEWHRQVKAGGADAILSSLRPNFDKHAKAIGHAKSAGINATSTLEHIVEIGEPGLIEAWRTLKDHVMVVSRIGRVAKEFGAQTTSMFPQIVQFNLGDNSRLNDEALMCCDGMSLEVDSSLFRQPDPIGHRTSPWFQTSLKLHSIESAIERYNAWAADQFDQMHSGPRGGRIIDGQLIEDPVPPNPYRQKTATR